jgi:hypothetical protein
VSVAWKASGSSLREGNRGVLVTDSASETSDHVANGAGGVSQHQAAAAALARVNHEGGADLATHVHYRARGVADDSQDYCTIVQHSPVYTDGAVVGHVLAHGHLLVVEPQAPQMNESVL